MTAVVTNDGPAAETQPVQFTVDDEPVSTQTVPLDPDESTDVAFTYGIVDEEPGDRDIEVSVAGSTAEGSTAEATISVPEPAIFSIDEIRAPSEVQQGRRLRVRVQITNTGDVAARRPISMEIDGRMIATRRVQIRGGRSRTVRLSARTDGGASGARTITVRTPDDAATATVEVVERRRR